MRILICGCLIGLTLIFSASNHQAAATPAMPARMPVKSNSSELTGDTLRVGPVDVAPTGWRRTLNGWERAESWPVLEREVQASLLNHVISQQHEAERSSAFVRRISTIMAFVRSIDPVTLVCSQVTLLALYIALVFHRETKADRKSCLKTTLPPCPSN